MTTAIEAIEERMAAPLTTDEQRDLSRCESTIARGMRTFDEVGKALLEIRDRRLYRTTFPTFADYCRGRWDLGKSRAYQMIDASEVVANLSTTVDVLPANEAQARPLAGLPADQQRQAWQAAVEASAGKPTAAHVAQAAAEMKPPAPRPNKTELAPTPFWQSISASHPTAHFWAEIQPGYWKAACGITTRRALSGSTDAEHCSSCTRATWEKETPKPAAQSYHARDLICSGCGGQWGAAGSLVNASGRFCPACVARTIRDDHEAQLDRIAEMAARQRTCTRCGQVSAELTSYQAGLVAEYPDRAVSLCGRCVPAILKERSERPRCEDCGAVATDHSNIGGILAWRCAGCKRAAEQEIAEQEGTDDWIGMAEVGMAAIRAAWQTDDRVATIHAALVLASAIAPDDLAELADQLDDADYEALACYRRDRSGSMLEKEAI